jgi:hypothetical protein
MSSYRRTSACDRSGRASAKAVTIGQSSPSSCCGRALRRPAAWKGGTTQRAVPPFLPARDNLEILDFGSGTGFYLGRWHELGFRNVHASDVSELAVERLRERYPSCEVTQLNLGGRVGGNARRPMFVLMNYPVDSASRVHRLCWRALMLAMAVGTRSARGSGRSSNRSSWRWSLP